MKKLSGKKSLKGRGFTLIELLVVIGIIGILAAIVIVAINPGRQFAQARNAQRWNDVNAILNAVHQYAVDHNGLVTEMYLTTTPTNIGSASGDRDICALLTPTYMTAMPFDPQGHSFASCTNYNTGYTIANETSGRIIVAAPGAELTGTTISVSR